MSAPPWRNERFSPLQWLQVQIFWFVTSVKTITSLTMGVRAGFMGVLWSHTGPHTQQNSLLGLIFYYSCLEILNNFRTRELHFYFVLGPVNYVSRTNWNPTSWISYSSSPPICWFAEAAQCILHQIYAISLQFYHPILWKWMNFCVVFHSLRAHWMMIKDMGIEQCHISHFFHHVAWLINDAVEEELE